MPKVIILVGLPASGKTTWARKYIKEHPEVVYSNKDTFRGVLYSPELDWHRDMEYVACSVRNTVVSCVLSIGGTVLVDDTNLNPIHVVEITEIARTCKADVVIQRFTDVSLEECIKRDSIRPDKERVGEEVIRNMHSQYLKEKA